MALGSLAMPTKKNSSKASRREATQYARALQRELSGFLDQLQRSPRAISVLPPAVFPLHNSEVSKEEYLILIDQWIADRSSQGSGADSSLAR